MGGKPEMPGGAAPAAPISLGVRQPQCEATAGRIRVPNCLMADSFPELRSCEQPEAAAGKPVRRAVHARTRPDGFCISSLCCANVSAGCALSLHRSLRL